MGNITCWDFPIRLKGGRWKNNSGDTKSYRTCRKLKPKNKHSSIIPTTAKRSETDMLLSAKEEGGRGGGLHDFKWPCYPCWDQTKNTLPVSFPWSGFMWGETKGHNVSFLFSQDQSRDAGLRRLIPTLDEEHMFTLQQTNKLQKDPIITVVSKSE